MSPSDIGKLMKRNFFYNGMTTDKHSKNDGIQNSPYSNHYSIN